MSDSRYRTYGLAAKHPIPAASLEQQPVREIPKGQRCEYRKQFSRRPRSQLGCNSLATHYHVALDLYLCDRCASREEM